MGETKANPVLEAVVDKFRQFLYEASASQQRIHVHTGSGVVEPESITAEEAVARSKRGDSLFAQPEKSGDKFFVVVAGDPVVHLHGLLGRVISDPIVIDPKRSAGLIQTHGKQSNMKPVEGYTKSNKG